MTDTQPEHPETFFLLTSTKINFNFADALSVLWYISVCHTAVFLCIC